MEAQHQEQAPPQPSPVQTNGVAKRDEDQTDPVKGSASLSGERSELETGTENVAAMDQRMAHARNVEETLKGALAAKLQVILSQPLGSRSLMELEKTARLARELLVVGKDPRALVRGPRALGELIMADGAGGATAGLVDTGGEESEGYYPGYNYPLAGPSPLLTNTYGGASSPKNETFGATVIRELISSVKALGKGALHTVPAPAPSAFELISAIGLARDRGLTDIAEKLEAQLFGELVAEDDDSSSPSAPSVAVASATSAVTVAS